MVVATKIKSEYLMNDYLFSCEIENKSPRTIEVYRDVIQKLIWFLRYMDFPEIPDTTAHHIRSFLHYLKTEPVRWENRQTKKVASETTVHDYCRTLRSFYNWCCREGYFKKNPFNNIRTPKTEEKPPDILTHDQINILLNYFNGKSWLQVRNKALLSVLIDTGIRQAELVNLNIDDVDLETGQMLIKKGKGNKSRYVCMGKKALLALRKYVLYHRKGENEALFLNRSGNRLKARGVKILIRRLSQGTGIHVSCHMFRHTYATNFLMNRGSIYELKTILGHSSMELVLRYTQHVDANYIVNMSPKYSTLDNL